MAKNKNYQNSNGKGKHQEINMKTERKGYNMLNMIATAVLSIAALIVSIIALYSSNHYAQMEYNYKMKPKIAVSGTLEATRNPVPGEDPLVAVKEFQLSVLEMNNLDQAYIIYANNRVEELSLDDPGDILKERVQTGLDTDPDIKVGEWEYRYFFVYFECLDGEGILYLLYAKSAPGRIDFNAISGVEVYGMAKETHENEEDYEGERIMAQEYVRILKELPEYIA